MILFFRWKNKSEREDDRGDGVIEAVMISDALALMRRLLKTSRRAQWHDDTATALLFPATKQD